MTSEHMRDDKKESNIIRPRSWLWLNIVLIVLVLLLVGVGIGFYYTKVQHMEEVVEQLNVQVAKAQEAHLIDASHWSTLQNKVDNQDIKLHQHQQSIEQLTLFEQQKQWRLNEMTYLIHLANIKLCFAHDIKSSQQLLDQAHTIILELHDPSLANLDQAIQTDMKNLATARAQNNAKLFIQIIDLEQQIDAMPLLGSSFMSEDEAPEEMPSSTEGWRERLKESLSQLKGFVVVRKTPNSLLPLIAQEQGEYINQYLHMQLGQAQWAVLQQNNAIYQASLKQAELWINRYYVVLNPETQHALSALNALQNKDVSFPKISLEKTINALSELERF